VRNAILKSVALGLKLGVGSFDPQALKRLDRRSNLFVSGV